MVEAPPDAAHPGVQRSGVSERGGGRGDAGIILVAGDGGGAGNLGDGGGGGGRAALLPVLGLGLGLNDSGLGFRA